MLTLIRKEMINKKRIEYFLVIGQNDFEKDDFDTEAPTIVPETFPIVLKIIKDIIM
jgi:hypothetical protein